jgi:hypothetical protein
MNDESATTGALLGTGQPHDHLHMFYLGGTQLMWPGATVCLIHNTVFVRQNEQEVLLRRAMRLAPAGRGLS